MLPKIHKKYTQGRLIVNSIDSITEKISDYIDEKIRPLVSLIQSHVKDKTHFINQTLGTKLKTEDLLVTIDVTSLYTDIPHNEGIAAI